MLENTGTPSGGQLFPVKGSQLGDESGRMPTKFSVCPVPFTVDPLGIWKVNPLGTVTVNWLSSANWLQLAGLPNEETLAGFALAIEAISKQVCGVARFKSFEASRRCPCEPT